MDRRSFITGAAALAAYAALGDVAEARRRRHVQGWVFPGAIADLNFARQRYWWNGAERFPSDFSSFVLGGGTLNNSGLTPASDTVITVSLAATGFALPGIMACAVNQSSNAPGGVSRSPCCLDGGSTAEEVAFLQAAASGNLTALVNDDAAGQTAFTAPVATTLGIPWGLAVSVDTNSVLFASQGRAATADTSATLPTLTILRLGKTTTASSQYVGSIPRVILINGAGTQGYLNFLTSRLQAAPQG